ncbi:MAG: Stk1 family PASTA domain-containing Ser/Thr kinase [Oscillospiraceae bacterium]|nr:Stk1 family PASTA domain-containing Ser/Thr kinase [Oscillospiraceae bacterium]
MDKYIGRLLDNRYEILEVLGVGGMAVVYKARCHRLNRFVAVKILKDDYLQDEEFRRRFHSESQAVAMLSHSNIVSVYDVSSSLDADYIVMELIDGITLKQYMEKKGVLNWKETLHFAIQIAKALEHAHSRGIVHRDIKPHNVMVLKNGSVKVTDFGIARMMSEGNTLTKEALGSVHYISPEQAKGGRVDNRSDIYSLGVVLYEMMSGRPPYDGESPVAVAIKHINGGAPMPSTYNPNIPGGLEQIIMKGMAHDPADRYDTATKMLADLDEFRKNPGILFDYNIPSVDVVAEIPKPPLILDPQNTKPTQAERAERRKGGAAAAAPGAARTNADRQAQRRRRLQQEQERKQSNATTFAIVLCCLVIVVALVVLMVLGLDGELFSIAPKTAQVPNLAGKVYATLPDYPDFDIKLDKEVYDDTVPSGEIISQKPDAGDEIAKGGDIYVIVSLGPAPRVVYMPDVAGQSYSNAERALNNLSMNLQINADENKREFHDEIPTGFVIRTDPAPNTQLTAGQKVDLILSKGPEIRDGTMPYVLGEKLADAKKILDSQELDLEYVEEEEYSSDIEKGCVIRTEPAADEPLQTGDTVKLIISKGPEMKRMQKLVGLSVNAAIEILKGDRFTNYEIEPVESDEPKDTVVEQSVAPKTEVDVNTKIVLKVSKGKPQPVESTKTVTIAIPTVEELGEDGFTESDYTDENGNVVLNLVLKLDGETVHTAENLNFSSAPLSVTLTGSGVVEYELWVNGNAFSVITVDFAA